VKEYETGETGMNPNDWIKEFPGAITICDTEGIILEMNDASIQFYAKDGGKELIGKNLLDCHPEPSFSMLKNMLEKGLSNIHTEEENGHKKLIYQVPFYQNGKPAGLVEFLLPLPGDAAHIVPE
jgi:transcriptional regulator with PAS, ATPase and Fis domain